MRAGAMLSPKAPKAHAHSYRKSQRHEREYREATTLIMRVLAWVGPGGTTCAQESCCLQRLQRLKEGYLATKLKGHKKATKGSPAELPP